MQGNINIWQMLVVLSLCSFDIFLQFEYMHSAYTNVMKWTSVWVQNAFFLYHICIIYIIFICNKIAFAKSHLRWAWRFYEPTEKFEPTPKTDDSIEKYVTSHNGGELAK